MVLEAIRTLVLAPLVPEALALDPVLAHTPDLDLAAQLLVMLQAPEVVAMLRMQEVMVVVPGIVEAIDEEEVIRGV